LSLLLLYGGVGNTGIPVPLATPSVEASQIVELCALQFSHNEILAARVPYSSLSRGHFEDRVISFGQIQIAPSDRSGSMSTSETTIDFNDYDRRIAKIVEGSGANSVIGTPVVRYLANAGSAPASWLTLFTGIITKPPAFSLQAGGLVARITARVDDAALDRLSPSQGWTVDRISWPNAHPDALTKPAARVYGKHAASAFQTGPGFIPGLYVDTVRFRYALAAGRLKAVDRVYVDGVEWPSSDLDHGWAMSHSADRRGRIWTILTFVKDQGSGVVTADVQGYDTVGDGTGWPMIENPADILAHALSNWHFGEWKNTAGWLATSSRIGTSLTSSTGVVKTFLAARMPKAAPCYTDRNTGYDMIRDFCNDHGLRAYWANGLIEFCVEDVAASPYSGLPLNWDQDLFEFGLDFADIEVSPAVRVENVHSASQGHYLSSFGVTLPDVSGDETDELPLIWSPAS
jgi:hypothetical protein